MAEPLLRFVLQFLKGGDPKNLDLSQQPDGGWRLHTRRKNQLGITPFIIGPISVGQTIAHAVETASPLDVLGFHIFGGTDAVIEFWLNGQQYGQQQLNYANPTPSFHLPAPFRLATGQNWELRITNVGLATCFYPGVMFRDI